jgi:uncharacterized membrane protein YhaH (DUF805 family)
MKKLVNTPAKTTIAIGPTFLELLTIVFIVLKLTHKIEWSWVWVLAPTWIPITLLAVLFAVCVIAPVIMILIKKLKNKRKY